MRLYEIFNPKRIERLLQEYFDIVGTYTIDEDGVRVEGNCTAKKRTKNIMNMIPFKFASVSGHFTVDDVHLDSMHNFPKEIGKMLFVKKTFITDLSELKNVNVGETIHLENNYITSLEGVQDVINGNFACMDSHLTSLKGGPTKVNGGFKIYKSNVGSLIGGPEFVGKEYDCRYNPIADLKGLPKEINGNLVLSYTENFPMLDIMLVKNLKGVKLWPEHPPNPKIIAVEEILNKHLNKGRAGAMQCAAELSRAGHKGNARR